MTLQFDLDFSQKLPPSAQIGMQQADENADGRWKRWVDGAIQAVARRLQEFTVDDVLSELEKLPNPPDTHNLAALGPSMKEVSKVLGYMALEWVRPASKCCSPRLLVRRLRQNKRWQLVPHRHGCRIGLLSLAGMRIESQNSGMKGYAHSSL